MTRMIWPLFLLAIAVVATGAQLDRQARINPGWSQAVPPPIRSFSQANIVAALLDAGDIADAGKQARHLVRLRPMEAAHSRMLAQVQLAQDPNASDIQALQMAGRLGWRDPATQYGMPQLAMAAGDGQEAARRLAAIWALSTDRDAMARLAPKVLADGDARAEFARLLASQPRWHAKVEREAPRELLRDLFSEAPAP